MAYSLHNLNTIDQYIFGICVYEYRNGLLFSQGNGGDLQINFTQCNFVIQANVSGASVINGTATLNSCNPVFKIINSKKIASASNTPELGRSQRQFDFIDSFLFLIKFYLTPETNI